MELLRDRKHKPVQFRVRRSSRLDSSCKVPTTRLAPARGISGDDKVSARGESKTSSAEGKVSTCNQATCKSTNHGECKTSAVVEGKYKCSGVVIEANRKHASVEGKYA
ncbi:hypothetical protein PHYSODRAFT_325493 [Phytophthora sojae]|uniref:Uncharacterized protein n=1 Tax=Phytophthora sojae (strain P6497) TaxID=1094619 RepID=G4YV71_PHYSP|nr:hypothetical protein PHYSODRAFT_325493 [Phytophthora sojae]EGZ24370.1 hypothetical protein PHYSODRAFT_325493 [Phytophthora sojae]|eukprot:XP_009519658.1 hypothetical protein PHYSODRAFT_325493 [Phytophthora sojae]